MKACELKAFMKAGVNGRKTGKENCKCREKTGLILARNSVNMAASADELEDEEYEALAYQQV